MSSCLTIISCAEWERMERSVAAAESYRIQSEEEIARLNALEWERQRELARICQENQRTAERSIETLTTSYRAAAAAAGQQARSRLEEQGQTFAGQLEQLRAQAAQASGRASALTEAAEAAAREYSGLMERVLAGHNRGKERAKKTLEEVDRLLEQIRALRPAAFLPAAYASLEAMRASIAANLQSEDFQAAIVVSQNSVLEASRTLIQLVLLNEQHNAEAGQLRARAAALQARAERISAAGGTLTLALADGQAELPYDISFWSYGAFDELAGQIRGLDARLRQDAPVGREALREISGQLDRLEERLDACDLAARKELAGAVAAETMAQRLYGSLCRRGWTLESSGRQDGDSRKPYCMTYTDSAGNTVSIVVAGGEQPESPSFIYEAFSDSDSMAAVVKAGVGAALQEEGLTVVSAQERDDCALNTSPDEFIRRTAQEAEQLSGRRRERVFSAPVREKRTYER